MALSLCRDCSRALFLDARAELHPFKQSDFPCWRGERTQSKFQVQSIYYNNYPPVCFLLFLHANRSVYLCSSWRTIVCFSFHDITRCKGCSIRAFKRENSLLIMMKGNRIMGDGKHRKLLLRGDKYVQSLCSRAIMPGRETRQGKATLFMPLHEPSGWTLNTWNDCLPVQERSRTNSPKRKTMVCVWWKYRNASDSLIMLYPPSFTKGQLYQKQIHFKGDQIYRSQPKLPNAPGSLYTPSFPHMSRWYHERWLSQIHQFHLHLLQEQHVLPSLGSTSNNGDHLILFDDCIVIISPGLYGLENLGWSLCGKSPRKNISDCETWNRSRRPTWWACIRG